MARPSANDSAKERSVEKQISLTILPQDPGSQDIRVDVTRNLSAKKRKGQRRLAAFLFAVMLLNLFPMGRDLFSYINMKRNYQDLQDLNQEITSLQQELVEERESLYTPAVIEQLAREELDLVMPGESKVFPAIPTTDMPRRENLRSNDVLH